MGAIPRQKTVAHRLAVPWSFGGASHADPAGTAGPTTRSPRGRITPSAGLGLKSPATRIDRMDGSGSHRATGALSRLSASWATPAEEAGFCPVIRLRSATTWDIHGRPAWKTPL